MQVSLNKNQWLEMQQLMGYLKGELMELERRTNYRACEVGERHKALVSWVDTLHQLIPERPPRQ